MTSASGSPSKERFIREQGLAAEVARLIEPSLEGLGFRLVRVQTSGRDGLTLQIMAERHDGTMTVKDCETVSRNLSPVLDAADVIEGSYHLEISSPGIDRPLVRASDFDDWAGYEAKIELKEPVSGRKRFRGTIEGLAEEEARIACEIEGEGLVVLGLPLALVDEAKLVLTDDLVREALRRAKRVREGRPEADELGDGMIADPDALEVEVGEAGPRTAKPSPEGRGKKRRPSRPPPS
ncbi:MAG TPA: ribosome maturation factor RimP [Hyphomicrobiaceae bacterium]|nr:ribosome maturation factor RimP [Hyphomicrobiaceae bacterium]